jgi:rifampicin phosphotransferase
MGKNHNHTMIHTLRFDEPLATQLVVSGGKGANLSILTQNGFRVPRGFIVTAAVYQEFISTAGELFAHLDELPFHDPTALRSASEVLQAELLRLPLPPETCLKIAEQLRNFPDGAAFSVRSSSTMEDLAGAAFAGQHDTFLNVVGLPDVLDRIRGCFASLWADRAIAYRHQQGFDHEKAVMAVVVQEMVFSESAGVGFSVNPINGKLSEMMINSNFGLGESVVSGEGEIDQWIIDKPTRAVQSTSIGKKSLKVMSGKSGTHEIHVNDSESLHASLTTEQLTELSELLVKIEEHYKFPQDIEWAFANGILWLLQSRPVTSIPPRWTRDESAERFPNVITPLTWDFVESGFHRSLSHSFELLGFPPFSGKWFAKFGHYIYGNHNAVELYGRRAPLAVRSLEELHEAIPKIREQFSWVQELPIAWMRDLDFYLITLGRYLAEPLESKTPLETWRHVLEVNEHGAQYFLPNFAISIAHGMAYRVLHSMLKLVIGPMEANVFFDDLMVWCETKTGQINRELFELAQKIRDYPELTKRLIETESRDFLEADGLGEVPEIAQRFKRFLRDHGHREVDFDAYAATWCEAPWIVVDNLRLICQSPMDPPPAEMQRELKIRAQQAEMKLFSMLPADLHFFFHELLRLARAYTSLDDLEHYQTTRLTPVLRRGLRVLGEKLVLRGYLSEPMDIFFAHQRQIEEALTEDTLPAWSDFTTHIREQKMAYHADLARKPEWVLGENTILDEEAGLDSNSLRGLAGSSGIAVGPVFLVLTPADFSKFPKGAVLVARTTNPTWTPLFYSAIAVITESGGPLSHGAVTAREMQIPAVMSVRECLTRLKNGQQVRVDGSTGCVEIL